MQTIGNIMNALVAVALGAWALCELSHACEGNGTTANWVVAFALAVMSAQWTMVTIRYWNERE